MYIEKKKLFMKAKTWDRWQWAYRWSMIFDACGVSAWCRKAISDNIIFFFYFPITTTMINNKFYWFVSLNWSVIIRMTTRSISLNFIWHFSFFFFFFLSPSNIYFLKFIFGFLNSLFFFLRHKKFYSFFLNANLYR